MKTRVLTIAFVLVALGLAGCSTVNSRINEKSAAFSALTPEQQARVKGGSVSIGDSTDVVYIALGQPDSRQERRTAEGSTHVWIYKSFHQEYVGTGFVGYRRVMYWSPARQQYFVHLVPEHTDLYATRTEDDIRVTFRDGKVTMIEQKT